MKLEIGNLELTPDKEMKIYQNSFVVFVFVCAILFFPKIASPQNLVPQLELASHWDGHSHDDFPFPYNSLWGWTAGNGREYAIIGSQDSIYFLT